MEQIIGYGVSFAFILYMAANMSDVGKGWGPVAGWMIGIMTVLIVSGPPRR